MKQLLFLIPHLVSLTLYSQGIEGRILSENHQPIAGAHVLNATSGGHAHADPFGKFHLKNCEKGDSLLISHVGYSPAIHIVTGDIAVTITLTETVYQLSEVRITPTIDALNLISGIDIATSPVNSSQEILRKVPGLVIGQHAGGGKAEQIFLRGFDIDHGTDLSVNVDGMPVNMVSHAHGQGYADLHFLIPETIENLNFGKGPYDASQGNFSTAGYVNFQTLNRLKNDQVKLEVGDFNTRRLLTMLQLLDQEDHSIYLATAYQLTDGPFESPQNFDRLNVMAKYAGQLSRTEHLAISASHFNSRWDASGQIPVRSVAAGEITRFGAIDDTEGGQTSRSNINLKHTKNINGSNTYLTNQAYYSHYDFELYSNFTFWLEDPLNGDQIRQKEDRELFGLTSQVSHDFHLGPGRGNLRSGLGFRSDVSRDNELSHTQNRAETLDTIQLGDIREVNAFGFADVQLEFGRWVFNPGLRIDQFDFQYNDALAEYGTESTVKAIVSPKFNILYNVSDRFQLYWKAGKGFHSNDTRVVTAGQRTDILPAAWGSDVGLIARPFGSWVVNVASWYLYSEQEFVYVGDAGIVEPSGRSRRMGIDLSARYQPLPWMYWDMDVNYTLARAIDEPEGNNYIPLAPDLTLMSGLHILPPSGVYGGAQLRWVKDRPANEDNSIVAEGYAIVDVNAGYGWRNVDLSLSVQNLFDVEWNETQFATESRLKEEPASIEEIHFTPGTPFFIKGAVSYRF